MHFSHFLISLRSNDYVKAASHFHISTFPRIAVSSIFAHNNYIIYYIIILLWGFYQPTRMCGNVEM